MVSVVVYKAEPKAGLSSTQVFRSLVAALRTRMQQPGMGLIFRQDLQDQQDFGDMNSQRIQARVP